MWKRAILGQAPRFATVKAIRKLFMEPYKFIHKISNIAFAKVKLWNRIEIDRLFLKLVAWFASYVKRFFFCCMANQKLGGRAISCGFDGDMLDSIALQFTLAPVLFAHHLCLTVRLHKT